VQSDTPTFLTTTEAAQRIGVNERTLRHYCSLGLIRFMRTPGGHRRFRVAEIDAFIERRSEGGAA
jgi:excisionase family DNA binding protein